MNVRRSIWITWLGTSWVLSTTPGCESERAPEVPSSPAVAPAVPDPPPPAPAAPGPPHEGPSAQRERYASECEQGDGQACFALGELLDQGRGGPADPEQARALFEQACGFGSEEACDALGH